MPPPSVLIYLMRRDLRVADNPVFYALATKKDHGFTHLLPLYILAASHIEVSGFLPEDIKSPYPEARSRIAGFWRCGPHRAKFLGECLWDLKTRLEDIGSGLCIRVGGVGEVVKGLLVSEELHVSGVWMTGEEGVDESREENEVKQACEEKDVEFQRWEDEKYFIDDRDLPFSDPSALPDVFTSYRKIVEPLRDAPRTVLPTPTKGSLPPFPSSIPPQHTPFTIPEARDSLLNCLLSPLNKQELINNAPAPQKDFRSAHPFIGGESHAQDRLNHLISSGSMTTYKETRNGLLGIDFSTKLSGFLALGCITARQIHASLLAFEDASDSCPEAWKSAQGFGEGENEGTKGVRFELLWRDYMRLCTRKFGLKLFKLEGFNGTADKNDRWHSPESKKDVVNRFLSGTTGMGFIDASQREIFYTGYTSNRARQNVASFLSKILKIDWRVGAEWYECMLIDYDLSSNWGNWQYVAGVGNDPRGENGRVFNPVKQAFDYDPEAKYVKAWVRELKDVTDPGEAFQAWTISEEKKVELGLNGLPMVKDPLNKINFTVGKRESSGRGAKGAGRGRFRGNSSGGGEKAGNNENNPNRISPGARPGGYRGRGYGSSRPGGGYGGRGYGGGGRLRGGGHGTGNGNYGRVGMVDQDTNIAQQQQQTTPSRDQNH